VAVSAGHIIGAKAGRERYAQIVEIVGTDSQRLEELSPSHPPGPPWAVPPVVVAAPRPDRERRPPGGVLVEGKIVARLLGLRLLRLDALIVLTPADLTAPVRTLHGSPPRPSARPSPVPTARPRVARPTLADALRDIDEGAQILAGTRQATVRRT
jgi:hypothetical protein